MVHPSDDDRIYCISKLLQLCKNRERRDRSRFEKFACLFRSIALVVSIAAFVGTEEEERVAIKECSCILA